MLVQEIEQHIAAFSDIRRIHRHLSEEIFDIRPNHCEGAETVPEIIESEQALRSHARALVRQRHKRTSQLNGAVLVFVQKLIAEMEHMSCGNLRLSVITHLPVGAPKEAVTSEYLFFVGIPHHELFVAFLACVEFVDVGLFSRAAACIAESDLTQTTNLLHHIRRVVCRDNINLVLAFVCGAEHTLRSKLTLKHFNRNRGDNLFHFHNSYTISLTHWAHSNGFLLLSNVCHGIGLPTATRKVWCMFLYISSTRYIIARLKGRNLSEKLARR